MSGMSPYTDSGTDCYWGNVSDDSNVVGFLNWLQEQEELIPLDPFSPPVKGRRELHRAQLRSFGFKAVRLHNGEWR
jgi:hypothetical protein